MSRSQQNQVFQQGQQQSGNAFADSENAYKLGQTDIGNYEDQLSRYAAANPYTAGGEFQNQENEIAANTSDAGARSAGAALQEEAARTGQNPAGVIGATKAMEQQGDRNLQGQEAEANQQRIQGEAGYNKSVLGASEFPVQAEESIASGEGGLYGKAFGEEEDAAKSPSFMDELGNQLISGGAQVGSAWASHGA